ncbi:MAG: hypothetical protein JO051_08530 [Acidobacteriaceae bacterium]|nr:hypothetical protein [Acidobacteriaceae bacterium]
MSAATAAQMVANAANAQLSRGPVTDEGKSVSSLNRLTHGLAGAFRVLSWETQSDFDALLSALHDDYQPQTTVERILVQKAAEHHWIGARALHLQESAMSQTPDGKPDASALNLYMRYQTTHDRAFERCIRQLRAIKNDRRREQIGFESQKRAAAQEYRRDNEELRRQEMHEARLRATNARTQACEIDSEIRQTIEAPLPGHLRVPFDTMKDAFRFAVHEVNRNLAASAPAT